MFCLKRVVSFVLCLYFGKWGLILVDYLEKFLVKILYDMGLKYFFFF